MIKLKARMYGWSDFLWSTTTMRSHSSIVLTIGGVQAGIALHILGCERFNHAINLLRLTRKADVHEQLPNSDIQRVAAEVESLDVSAQRFSVKSVRTKF